MKLSLFSFPDSLAVNEASENKSSSSQAVILAWVGSDKESKLHPILQRLEAKSLTSHNLNHELQKGFEAFLRKFFPNSLRLIHSEIFDLNLFASDQSSFEGASIVIPKLERNSKRKLIVIRPENAPPQMIRARSFAEKIIESEESLTKALKEDQSYLEQKEEKAKLLLHVCCGPDAGGVISQLKKDFDLTCFWYDPNIQPASEHQKRLDAFLKVAKIEEVPAIVGEYDVDSFFERIKGLEHTPEKGAKCSHCYDMRLERSALEAKEKGFDAYATTLAISPHKVQNKLIAFGQLNEKKYGIPYFHRNFMASDGFKDSVSYSNEFEIYRQDYCGCYWSLHEGGARAKKMAEELGFDAPSIGVSRSPS